MGKVKSLLIDIEENQEDQIDMISEDQYAVGYDEGFTDGSVETYLSLLQECTATLKDLIVDDALGNRSLKDSLQDFIEMMQTDMNDINTMLEDIQNDE